MTSLKVGRFVPGTWKPSKTVFNSLYKLCALWSAPSWCYTCVIAARCYIALPVTLNVAITSATTRHALASTRPTRKETVPRTGHTAPLHTATPIYASQFMTSASWTVVPGRRLWWKHRCPPVWNPIASWMKIRSGMVCLLLIFCRSGCSVACCE